MGATFGAASPLRRTHKVGQAQGISARLKVPLIALPRTKILLWQRTVFAGCFGRLYTVGHINIDNKY